MAILTIRCDLPTRIVADKITDYHLISRGFGEVVNVCGYAGVIA